MNEYRKIANVFKFDAKYKTIVGLNEPFNSLKNLMWVGTEKVDGTNIRIIWDGYKIEIKGRTDNAQFQGELYDTLSQMFLTKEMEYVFEQIFENKEVIIYGEGYGPKIQTGGGLYSDKPKFIVFDINIDGHYLKRANVLDICEKLNLDVVPDIFLGTIDEAKKFVSKHPSSTINEKHEMEGLVLELPLEIFDKNGNPLKCKVKYRDMLKGNLIN